VKEEAVPVDLLVFGPHPDDIEIGLGGTVARHAALGCSVGLCDLTRGELGTNGTPEERLAEAEAARRVMGAAWRENLGWPDGAIGDHAEHLREAVALVRRARPRTIAIPWGEDRHPDHNAASRLLAVAAFRSGLTRYPSPGHAWRPDWIVFYFINDSTRPSFVIDVSEQYDIKRQALECHRSQFQPGAPGALPTRLTSPHFRQLIESRDAQFGALAGCSFAEGVIVRDLLERPHLFKDLAAVPAKPPEHGSTR
jgi:bacillithiol biosynthesis deacetylase BshB1